MLPGSVLGDGRVLGVAEYRFSALQDLQWNMVQFGWVRELQLIGFGGVGASFTHAAWSQPEWAAELGLGARLHVEWGGFLPGLIAIDMAMPLRDIHRNTPVNMRIGFSQFF